MKKFLNLFGSVAAAFASIHSLAEAKVLSDVAPNHASSSTASTVIHKSNDVSIVDKQGEEFLFILKRSEDTGVLMAYHSSHRSHSSNRSHSSHYSGR